MKRITLLLLAASLALACGVAAAQPQPADGASQTLARAHPERLGAGGGMARRAGAPVVLQERVRVLPRRRLVHLPLGSAPVIRVAGGGGLIVEGDEQVAHVAADRGGHRPHDGRGQAATTHGEQAHAGAKARSPGSA